MRITKSIYCSTKCILLLFLLVYISICMLFILQQKDHATIEILDYGLENRFSKAKNAISERYVAAPELETTFPSNNKRLHKGILSNKTPNPKHMQKNSVTIKTKQALKVTSKIKLIIRNYNETIKEWMEDKISLCNGVIKSYANLFSEVSILYVNPSRSHGNKGGENLLDVKGQSEKKEYLALKNGYFQVLCLNCSEKQKYTYRPKDPKNKWLEATSCLDKSHPNQTTIWNDIVIAVTRYEYVNLYHTICDWYNTFLMINIFKIQDQNVTVLWMDAHPKGLLDAIWKQLFGKVVQASSLRKPKIIRKMVWSINGYDSLLNHHSLPMVPHLEEFSNFFYASYNIQTDENFNCSNLRILIIFRRDFVAHPRNTHGHIQRKIKNENEILLKLSACLSNFDIKGVQMDNYTMGEQLKMISQTDILIGIHGAGLSHILFLPKHSGVIEIYPRRVSTKKEHFKAFSRWRKLYYLRWQNFNESNEDDNDFIYIPPKVIEDLILKMQKEFLCK